MKNFQRGFIVPFLIIIIALVAIGGLYVYTGNKQTPTPINLGNRQNVDTTSTTVTSSTTSEQNVGEEAVFTGGDVQLPDCFRFSDPERQCVLLHVGERCYIPNAINSAIYTYSEDNAVPSSTSYSFKRGSYIWPVNASGVITKGDYDTLFPDNQISSSTIIKAGDDVSMYLRTFQAHDNQGNTYLFDSKGRQMASLSDLNKHLIPFSWTPQFGTDWDSLETIRRLKTADPVTFAAFPEGPYVPTTSPLQKIDIVYECVIENGAITAKKKIQELNFFKDGTFITIQL